MDNTTCSPASAEEVSAKLEQGGAPFETHNHWQVSDIPGEVATFLGRFFGKGDECGTHSGKTQTYVHDPELHAAGGVLTKPVDPNPTSIPEDVTATGSGTQTTV